MSEDKDWPDCVLEMSQQIILVRGRKGNPYTCATTWSPEAKEKLRYLYWDQKLSQREIAELLKVDASVVCRVMRKFGIKPRSTSEANLVAISSGRLPVKGGSDHPNWKGGSFKHGNSGYVFVWNPDHHRANKKGYVREHILIWEETNKRPLPDGYDVHHLNGIKDDNRPENLVAVPKPQHEKNTLLKLAQERIRNLEAQIAGILGEVNE